MMLWCWQGKSIRPELRSIISCSVCEVYLSPDCCKLKSEFHWRKQLSQTPTFLIDFFRVFLIRACFNIPNLQGFFLSFCRVLPGICHDSALNQATVTPALFPFYYTVMILRDDTIYRVSRKSFYQHYTHVPRNTPLIKTNKQQKVTDATKIFRIFFPPCSMYI
jgi:hypothetical protein